MTDRYLGGPAWRGLWCVALCLVAAGLSGALWSCAANSARRAGAAWPAALGPVPKVPARPADNSECLICHLDFKKEPLAVGHAAIGLGCAACHGESGAHGDDESNIITPDVTFGRAEIRPFCTTCHQTHNKGKVLDAFLARWADKRRPNGRIVSAESVCTDCHGNHAVLRPDQLNPAAPG